MTNPLPLPLPPEPQSAPIPYTREFLVDPGYAGRVTLAIVFRVTFRRPLFYIGVASALVGAGLMPFGGQYWVPYLIFGVFFSAVFPVLLFLMTRRAYRKQIPAGSRLRTGFGYDRFAIDSPMSTTSVAYAMYNGAERRGDFVFLRQRSLRRWVAFPGQLFGDEDLARFPQR